MKQINMNAAFGVLLALVALAFLVLKGSPQIAERASAALLTAAGLLIAAFSGKVLSPLPPASLPPPRLPPRASSSASEPSEESQSSDGSWPPLGGP